MKRGSRIIYSRRLAFFIIVIFLAVFASAIPEFHEWGTTNNFTEDQGIVFTYNFSANVTDPVQEEWIFSIENIIVDPDLGLGNNITNYTWISLDSSTGIMVFNATNNNQTGFFNISIQVRNPSQYGESRPFYFNVTSVNDAPYFTNLENLSFNMSQMFSKVFNTTDEENNFLFWINVTILDCTPAEWWNKTVEGCGLFNSSDYAVDNTLGSINLTFTPGKYDVGTYLINFSVNDSGNPSAGSSQVAQFVVLDVNTPPLITKVCDYSVGAGTIYINVTENQTLSCYVNATDIGEGNNLTFDFSSLSGFSSDLTWFANSTIVPTNLSVNYTSYVFINATPGLLNVGNWTINISVNDTGTPSLTNSTIVQFYVSNLNRSVSLDALSDYNLSNSTSTNILTLYVNATDDDLLILDKSVYNENLTFNITANGVSVSWINITSYQTLANITTAKIQIDSRGQPAINYSINVSVVDANNYSSAFRMFNLSLRSNSAPVWDNIQTTQERFEGWGWFSFNYSANVSDAEGDAITFSYSSDTSFPSFNLNLTTGILNFTTDDSDVGQHIVTITATDILYDSTSLIFNFTVSNENDNPIMPDSLSAANFDKNYSWAAGTNTLSVQEDKVITMNIQVADNDFLIPTGQKSFYNESVNISVSGIRTTLLNFTGIGVSGNLSSFTATFTPLPSDTGDYNVTLTVTDSSGLTDSLVFNLTVNDFDDAPVIETPSENNFIYAIGEVFYADINATDEEDGSEDLGNFTYYASNLSAANFIVINSTTGIINLTLNQSHAGGSWRFNVSVNDTGNNSASWTFNITVYDYPLFVYPAQSYNFTLSENALTLLNFSVNHSVGNDLNYSLYINNVLKNQSSSYGNGSNITFYVSTNYTDESCRTLFNLTLNASNLKLANLSAWNVNITHTDQNLTIYANISNQTGGGSVRINLSDYFADADASDGCYNQTINFTVFPLSTPSVITYSVSDVWSGGNKPYVTFSYSSSIIENFSIMGQEYNVSNSSQLLRNVTSNNFSVQLYVSESVTIVQSPSSGGGGGATQPVYLKIIMPGSISANSWDKIIIPIQLYNPGKITLNEIQLSGSVAKGGVISNAFSMAFEKTFFDSLGAGESKNTTLTIGIDTADNGIYEVNIYGNVTSPDFYDWGKIFINVGDVGVIKEKILFTDKLIVENPECLEIKEMVDEAKEAYDAGEYEIAQKKIDDAANACKKAISQKSFFFGEGGYLKSETFTYVAVASFIAFILGIIYYYYGRIRLQTTKSIKEEI